MLMPMSMQSSFRSFFFLNLFSFLVLSSLFYFSLIFKADADAHADALKVFFLILGKFFFIQIQTDFFLVDCLVSRHRRRRRRRHPDES